MGSRRLSEKLANFTSYCTVYISGGVTTTSAGEYSVFSTSNASSDPAPTIDVLHSTPDISFDSTTGKITFGVEGTYLIYANLGLIEMPSFTSSDTTTLTAKIKINGGTDWEADVKKTNTASELSHKEEIVGHIVRDVDAGDTVEVAVRTSNSETVQLAAGAHITVVRVLGQYGHVHYTADSNQTAANTAAVLGDSDLGGTTTVKTSGVTFTANTGIFTVGTTGNYLMLGHEYAENADLLGQAAMGNRHMIYVTGSLTSRHTMNQPYEHNDPGTMLWYGRLVSSEAGCSFRKQHVKPSKINKGSSFSVIDIQGKTGTASSGVGSSGEFMGETTDSGDAENTGTQILFDSDDGFAAIETNGRLAGLAGDTFTFTSSAGKFSPSVSGTYLISLIYQTSVSSGAGASSHTLSLNVNGSAIFSKKGSISSTSDAGLNTFLVVCDLNSGDEIQFVTVNPKTTSPIAWVTMVKIDAIKNRQKRLTIEERASSQIAKDGTINTFERDVIGKQYSTLTDRVLPFSKAIGGPTNLRGRTTAYAPSLGGSEKK